MPLGAGFMCLMSVTDAESSSATDGAGSDAIAALGSGATLTGIRSVETVNVLFKLWIEV